jgi:hypothetical protein
MSEPTDRFVIEIGTGTVAHIIDTDADQSETDSRFSLGLSGPGEKMCSRGNRHPGDKRVPFAEFASHHDIDKAGFEGDAPDEICSYCWSNTREAVGNDRDPDDLSEQIGTVGYRLGPETTMAELDRLVCRITTLDDFHLRMYGLEDEYLESSLNILPDHQYEEAGDRTYTRASEMTIADVAERARLREGDRLSLVYDFGTPSHYYCIVKEVYEPDRLDEVLDGDVITSTDTAAIVREKRP